MNPIDMHQPQAARMWEDLNTLATLTEDTEPGWTRRIFSEPYRAEREHMLDVMRRAGLEASIDAAGNVVGRLRGKHPGLPPLVTGSHTDTVHAGGRFDGMVGVLGSIEVARILRESGIELERDLIVIDFLGEEANPFGLSCLGSRAISGQLSPEHFDRTDGESDQTLGEAFASFGLDPNEAMRLAWKPDSIHGYLELHIEQGPVMEREGLEIGVVTAIAGIERLMATFAGRADHAGTMPMEHRHDALIGAAEAILTIEREACGAPIHGVSTTGRIESSPGSFNIVPDEAKIWAEVRSVDADWLTGAKRRLAEKIAADAAARGLSYGLDWLNDQPPVPTERSIQNIVGESAGARGLSWDAIPSGAGHDAAHMTHLGPMGMLFIPSVGGRSHVPEEDTPVEDIVRGVSVLAESLVRMDATELVRNA